MNRALVDLIRERIGDVPFCEIEAEAFELHPGLTAAEFNAAYREAAAQVMALVPGAIRLLRHQGTKH
jgi:hypothetical protein